MTTQNPNPPADPLDSGHDLDGDPDGTITLPIKTYNANMAAARRGDAPARSSSSDRLDRIEGALDKLVGVLSGQAAPQATPSSAPAAPTPPPVAAAPSAPASHNIPTSMGLPNLWAMTSGQIDQMGPDGVRRTLEEAWRIGHKMAGAPARPEPPGSVKSLESEVRALARAVRKGS